MMMPFVTIPGVVGKVYVPEEQTGRGKKHKCKDCFSCQHCSDDRCSLCRGETFARKEEREKTCETGFQ